MSRLLFVAVVVLTLLCVVTSSPLYLSVPASDLAPLSDCANDCSSHGRCVKTSSGTGTCLCEPGYLAVDCSIPSVMKPLCWLDGRVCSYWNIQNDFLYLRAIGSYAGGWLGIMWGSTDGMAGGQSTIMALRSAYLPLVFEGHNKQKGRPMNLTSQSIAQSNVTGGASNVSMSLDVSFHRRLVPDADHFAISSAVGSICNMSVAFSYEFYDFHQNNATFFTIDIAAAAQGQWDSSID